MVKLVWTDQAIDDLDDIGNYIAENSARYARLTIQKLFERTEILKDFPLAGRIVPEKNDENVREWEIIEFYTKSFQLMRLIS